VAARRIRLELALDEADRIAGRALALQRRNHNLPLALREITQLSDKCLKIMRLHGGLAR